MAFNDIGRKRIERATAVFLAKRRPSPHARPDPDADECGCFFG
jgi:hypothetical protein